MLCSLGRTERISYRFDLRRPLHSSFESSSTERPRACGKLIHSGSYVVGVIDRLQSHEYTELYLRVWCLGNLVCRIQSSLPTLVVLE
jgi:hypothetical protein